jgi:vacuolar-type H+-ATPase subunit E/Vma4
VSFDKLKQALLDEAKKQADTISDGHRRDLLREEERIKKHAVQIKESIIYNAQEEGIRQAKRLHQEAQLQARANILREKQKELDITIKQATEKILAWDSGEAEAIIKDLMSLVPEQEGKIVAGEKHKEIVVKEAKKKNLSVSDEVIKDDGGFVYKGKEIEQNLLISYLVQSLFERHRADIARVLFT